MGRGDTRLIKPSIDPLVQIGLTISTSPASLSSSLDEPFYIVVTARILNSPRPDQAITLRDRPSALGGTRDHCFHNIQCTTDSRKQIEIKARPHWHDNFWDPANLREKWTFVTIPPARQGALTIRHEIPRDAIMATNVVQGETYRVSLTENCLGARWWTYGDLKDFEGCRFRTWRPADDKEIEQRRLVDLEMRVGEAAYADIERERKEKEERYYEEGPTVTGEQPSMLAMISEVGEVEFQIA